jgi:succinate dehydrogenase flavin-adding protein (antitoxin of CptAB toxin-antitoxin module)
MKKYLFALLVIFSFSCSKKSTDLVVTGTVKDIKKGTIYLQKIIDTALVSVDSLTFNGNSTFELSCELKEPEVLYLNLNDNTSADERIRFFAEKGMVEINTTLKGFSLDAEINGGNLQKQLEDYHKIANRFDDAALDLIVKQVEAAKTGDTNKINEAQKNVDNNLKRKYLYTINFALNHKNSEVAPYIALAEIYDANIKYLDTIYGALPKPISSSKYGKELNDFIGKRKEAEKQ